MPRRSCDTCGCVFTAARVSQRFCSDACRQRAHRERVSRDAERARRDRTVTVPVRRDWRGKPVEEVQTEHRAHWDSRCWRSSP
jgi:predicted nucleic acid-binding Zn ribbon protein